MFSCLLCINNCWNDDLRSLFKAQCMHICTWVWSTAPSVSEKSFWDITLFIIIIIINCLPLSSGPPEQPHISANFSMPVGPTLEIPIEDRETLSCESEGYPRPTLTWIHNGFILTQGQQGPLKVDELQSTGVHRSARSLELQATANASGNFSCLTNNGYGPGLLTTVMITRLQARPGTGEFIQHLKPALHCTMKYVYRGIGIIFTIIIKSIIIIIFVFLRRIMILSWYHGYNFQVEVPWKRA